MVDPEMEEMLAEARGATTDEAVRVDMSEAMEDFAVIVGSRPVEVVGSELKTSQKGDPYINLQLRVSSGEDAGRRVFMVCMLTGKGTGITKRTLDALGANIDWENPYIIPASLLGLNAVAVCNADPRPEYNTRTVISRVIPTPKDDAQLKLPV